MNTNTMLRREDFDKVLFRTIEEYYETVHSLDVKVSIEQIAKGTKEYLFLLPLFCSPFPVSSGARDFLYSEYNIRGNIVKYVVGKLGVFFITHLFGVGAHKTFYLSSHHDTVKNSFIAPCNRTIRFYNFEKDYVDCFAKYGYRHDFLSNQIYFRASYKYPFIPQIITYGDRWYRERIMHGHALARVRNKEKHDEASKIAIQDMRLLANDTKRKITAYRYYLKLIQELTNILNNLDDAVDSTMQNTFLNYVYTILESVKNSDFDIILCMSHGDLQEGNIWIEENGDLYIYDWETAKERSIWYDPITFFYHMHGGMMHSKLLEILQQDDRYCILDEKREYTNQEKKLICNIVILEDLLFNLDEAFQLDGKYKSQRIEEIFQTFKNVLLSERNANEIKK